MNSSNNTKKSSSTYCNINFVGEGDKMLGSSLKTNRSKADDYIVK
jgi:hypothetical protein